MSENNELTNRESASEQVKAAYEETRRRFQAIYDACPENNDSFEDFVEERERLSIAILDKFPRDCYRSVLFHALISSTPSLTSEKTADDFPDEYSIQQHLVKWEQRFGKQGAPPNTKTAT